MQPRCTYCDRTLFQRVHTDLSWTWCERGTRRPHLCPDRREAIDSGEVLVRISAADWDRKEAGLTWPQRRNDRFDVVVDALICFAVGFGVIALAGLAFAVVLAAWYVLFD
jgi:hypothetical protein